MIGLSSEVGLRTCYIISFSVEHRLSTLFVARKLLAAAELKFESVLK